MTHDNIPTVCGHVQPHPPTTPTTGYFTNSTTEQVTLAHVGQMLATVAAVAYSPTTAAETHNSMPSGTTTCGLVKTPITIFGKSDYKPESTA